MADTIRQDFYRCKKCGNIVKVYHAGKQNLTCCNQRMERLYENTTDSKAEKHIPVIIKIDEGYKVTVGDEEHPMTEEHHIRWIELTTDHKTYTRFLLPGSKPEAFFNVQAMRVIAKAYCNLHGLWKNES